MIAGLPAQVGLYSAFLPIAIVWDPPYERGAPVAWKT